MRLCPFCLKPFAYALPSGEWYRPPLVPNLWTITTITTNTTATSGFPGTFQPVSDSCYGHTFVHCKDCGMPVPYGLHTPESCSILRGFKQGIAELRATMDETMPLRECLPEHIDVPQAFHEAFAEQERL